MAALSQIKLEAEAISSEYLIFDPLEKNGHPEEKIIRQFIFCILYLRLTVGFSGFSSYDLPGLSDQAKQPCGAAI